VPYRWVHTKRIGVFFAGQGSRADKRWGGRIDADSDDAVRAAWKCREVANKNALC
jgi:hypothetical protein